MNNDNLFELDKVEANRESVNIKEVLAKYFNYIWLFVIIIVLALVGAWLYLRYTTPKYKVEATLMIRNDNARGGGSNTQDAMFSSMLMMQSSVNKQNEMQLMQSRSMLTRVVQKLGLTKQYYAEGNVKKTSIYSESPIELHIVELKDTSAPFSWKLHFTSERTFTINENKKEYFLNEPIVNERGRFVIKPVSPSPYKLQEYNYIITYLPEYLAAISLSSGLTVTAAKDNSNMVTLQFVTENPRMGAEVLNTLMSEYNQAAVEDKNETNLKVVSFLEDRLKLVESQLDSVETSMMYYRKSKDIIDLTAQSGFYFENMGATGQTIREQEVKIKVLDILEDYVKNAKNKNNLVPSTMGIEDPTLQSVVAAYNDLVVNRQKEIQTGALANNVVIQNLDNDIEEARNKILRSLENIRGVYKGALNTLETQSQTFKNQISSIPEKEKGSRDMARQQEIKQSLYLYILQKKEESSIALASTISNALILDPALNLRKQISPNRNLVYGMAVLLGLLVPIAIIFIIDFFNDRVTTRTDITKATQAPIIGEIGHNEDKNVLVFAEKSRSILAEQIRILRTNLRFQFGDASGKHVILITSSFSGEGKSFISTNLGAALAIAGKKTVILEFDLRKPKIMAGLGLQRGAGLTNYLVGGATKEELVIPVDQVENLYVIPCGPVPPNPAEILLNPLVPELFQWLRKNFDTIIIDTAPIGLVSDAVTLGTYADASLYVIRQRYTFKRQLQFINDLYKSKKMPNMGLIVNDVVVEGAKGYYGYGSDRYGYGYGYGHGKEKSKTNRKKSQKEKVD